MNPGFTIDATSPLPTSSSTTRSPSRFVTTYGHSTIPGWADVSSAGRISGPRPKAFTEET
ncbi:hypothetical protein D3C83_188830 [compost metagenome]